MMKFKKQPALACPIDAIGASARPMVMFSGFYESPGPPPLDNACGIVPPHRDDHQNGHQSGYIVIHGAVAVALVAAEVIRSK